MATTYQMLIRGVDGRTSCIRLPTSTIGGSLLQELIATTLRIPAEFLLVVSGTRVINPHTFLCASGDGFFPSCSILLRLRGGKGGFGSLLRGAATKAGQKKTSNFDACRDMSGRRLRHVNAEKKLKEWKAQSRERELEKAANEFLKKQAKQKDDESGCSQVIETFQEDTFRAREDVESAVAQGLAEAKKLGKRKIVDDSLGASTSSKRTYICEIDTIEEDSEGECDEDVVAKANFEGGNGLKDEEESSEDLDMEKGYENDNCMEGFEDDKVDGPEVAEIEGRFVDEKANGKSEDEKAVGRSEVEKDEEVMEKKHVCNGLDSGNVEVHVNTVKVVEGDGYRTSSISASIDVDLRTQSSSVCVEKFALRTDATPVFGRNTCNENGFHSQLTTCSFGNVKMKDLLAQSKLNLGDYRHPSELEVIGLERLKQELQMRGLKCGGSLAERAGRLFLLKTVPLEKLDKRHFAKARA